MRPSDRPPHSVRLLSSSSRYWPRIRDLYTLVILPIDIASFTKNSTKKRRLPLSLLRNLPTPKSLMCSQPCRQTHKTREKSSLLTTRSMKQSSADSRCTPNQNSWTCPLLQELPSLLRKSQSSPSEIITNGLCGRVGKIKGKKSMQSSQRIYIFVLHICI